MRAFEARSAERLEAPSTTVTRAPDGVASSGAPASIGVEPPASLGLERPAPSRGPAVWSERSAFTAWLGTAFLRATVAVSAVAAALGAGGCASPRGPVPEPAQLGWVLPAGVRADPGVLGPYAVTKKTMVIPGADGRSTTADVYLPEGPGPFPVVVHAHGLWSNRNNHAGTATHYASHGIVTIVPDLPHGSDNPRENSVELGAHVAWLLTKPEDAIGAKLDVTHGIGLSGHSFGALTAVLAGTTPGVGAIVGLDPADQNGKGKDAAPNVRVPTAFVVGVRELANQLGNSGDIYGALGGTKELVRVAGAHHGDFENDSTSGPKHLKNAIAMRWATAFLLRSLRDDPAYAPFTMSGPEITAAQARGEVSDYDSTSR